ncbi:MAG TPA: RluA family pseudouridine synthase [Acidimicrobiia bacterium]|nr:RluA family pseudouridine synthase [Acidimicrobiia bacterium]
MDSAVTLTVPSDLDGERLDRALAVLLDVSRAVARSLVDSGVEIDGVPSKPNARVVAGMSIRTPAVVRPAALRAEPMELTVLYEDDHLVVIDKPPGMVVHPGSGQTQGTLAAGLLHRYPELDGVGAADRWGLVHRLDKDTSGAILVARNQEAFDGLTGQLRERKIHREYLTLVEGVLKPPTGTIDAPIGRDPGTPTRRAVIREGKHARTHYRLVKNYDEHDLAFVKVTLETGRTHQIRVHFAAIGHPIVGDATYGSRREPGLSPRIFLHAGELKFKHPSDGSEIVVTSPLPADLAAVLDSLEDH